MTRASSAASVVSMTRVMLRSSLALVLVLVAAAPACAKTRSAYVDWMPTFLAAAHETWGQAPPPCGSPTFAWADEATLRAQTQLDPAQQASWFVLLGSSNVAACRVTINVEFWHNALRYDPRFACTLVVHELGHLYGHTHVEGGIMAAILPNAFRPCDRRIVLRHVTFRHGHDVVTNVSWRPR